MIFKVYRTLTAADGMVISDKCVYQRKESYTDLAAHHASWVRMSEAAGRQYRWQVEDSWEDGHVDAEAVFEKQEAAMAQFDTIPDENTAADAEYEKERREEEDAEEARLDAKAAAADAEFEREEREAEEEEDDTGPDPVDYNNEYDDDDWQY